MGVKNLGLRIWEFRVGGFRVRGLGLRFKVLGLRVWGFTVQGFRA